MRRNNIAPWYRRIATVLTLLGGATAAQAGCVDVPEVCTIPTGSYHIELPATAGAGTPALMFLHGFGSSGLGTMNMRGVVDAALKRGYAVIAPDGIPRPAPNAETGRTWAFYPMRPGPRDEIAFLQAVRDDAVARHGIDPARVLLGGFSLGGAMTSYTACAAPAAFAAYLPVAGAFWYPLPTGCAGPVDLFQTHGWADSVVPLEGRILRGGTSLNAPDVIAQGDVWQAMQIWRAVNGCRPNPGTFAETGAFWRRRWDGCDSGRHLEFALFPGGHLVPDGWTDMALTWFEAL